MSKSNGNRPTKQIGYCAYILHCRDNSLYTGYSNRIEQRIKTHQNGKGAKYTRSKRPVYLEYCQRFPDISSGLRWEARLKKLSKMQKHTLCKEWKCQRLYLAEMQDLRILMEQPNQQITLQKYQNQLSFLLEQKTFLLLKEMDSILSYGFVIVDQVQRTGITAKLYVTACLPCIRLESIMRIYGALLEIVQYLGVEQVICCSTIPSEMRNKLYSIFGFSSYQNQKENIGEWILKFSEPLKALTPEERTEKIDKILQYG